jgi:hypothetical protein
VPLDKDLSWKSAYQDLSNNVGSVKLFLSALRRSLRLERLFRFYFPLAQRPRLARNLSVGFQSDSHISSIHTSTMITRSNSLCRERDAH